MKKLTFQNGDQMDLLGLGTWKSTEGEAYKAVTTALEAGYRHIDCARIYGNQAEIGQAFQDAFQKGLLKREELWVTSKLWNSSHLKEDVRPELEKTLKDLQLDYLDLYLIHWPVAAKPDVYYPKEAEDFLSLEEAPLEDTWKALESCANEGLIRHLGVSNFNITKIKQILDVAKVRPEMNQVEMHPFLPQQKLVDYCKSEKIHMTAYSPLGSFDRPDRIKKETDPILMEYPVIVQMAETKGCTPAQLLIAWSVNRGVAVIPKSSNPGRIRLNFEAASIDLTEAEMKRINEIDYSFRYIDGSTWAFDGSPYRMEDLWEM